MKHIPIPRTVRTTKEVRKILQTEQPSGTTNLRPVEYLERMFPENVDPSTLHAQNLGNHNVWYHVDRTRSGNLPVYTDYNNAGGVWTEIRRISGNVSALRDDLKAYLDLPKKDIWIQDTSKHIVIKGNRCSGVRKFLEQSF